ncbi:MAG: Gfo/Idh/MocA family oxidoreductase [Calditrichota bacterium]
MLSWGIIGSGDVVRRKVLPSFKECNADIRGIASRRLTMAENVAAEFNLPIAYTNVEALLTDPSIDAVYIATPVSSHAELTIKAAKAGKHVLCEKPMAMSHSEALEMLQACRRYQVHLEIAYYRRHFPVVSKLRQLLESGKIGVAMRAQVNCHSPRTMVQGSDWRYEPDTSGGGVLMDIGSHRIDLLIHLFGAIKSSSGKVLSIQETKVEDDCLLQLQFESGLEATLSIAWSKADYEDSLVIRGKRGVLRIDKINTGMLLLETEAGTEEFSMPMNQQTHTCLIEDFAERISLLHKEPLTETTAIETTMAIQDVYQANNYFTA